MEVTPVVTPGAVGPRVSRQLCRLEQPARSISQDSGRARRPKHELCAAAAGAPPSHARAGGPLFHGSRRRRPARPLLRYNIIHVEDALRDRAADHRWPADGRSRASCMRISLEYAFRDRMCQWYLCLSVCVCRREFDEWTCRVVSSCAPKFHPTPFVINLIVLFLFFFFSIFISIPTPNSKWFIYPFSLFSYSQYSRNAVEFSI